MDAVLLTAGCAVVGVLFLTTSVILHEVRLTRSRRRASDPKEAAT